MCGSTFQMFHKWFYPKKKKTSEKSKMKELQDYYGYDYSGLHKTLVRDAFAKIRMIQGVSIMNTVKLSAVHYQMLLELAKKKHIKPVNYLEELIQEIFNSK